jgi:hypothetical protein
MSQEGYMNIKVVDSTQVYYLKYTLDEHSYDGKDTLYCNFLTHPTTTHLQKCIRSIPNQPFGESTLYWMNNQNEGTDKNDKYYKITKVSNLKNKEAGGFTNEDNYKWVIWNYWSR